MEKLVLHTCKSKEGLIEMTYWVELEKQLGIRENIGTLTEARAYCVRCLSTGRYGHFARIYDSANAKNEYGVIVKEDSKRYIYMQYNKKGQATVYQVKRTGELVR